MKGLWSFSSTRTRGRSQAHAVVPTRDRGWGIQSRAEGHPYEEGGTQGILTADSAPRLCNLMPRGGRGPRCPVMSSARRPPRGGSLRKEPGASGAHPLRHRSAGRPEQERPVPRVGALSSDARAASRRSGWARGVLSSPPPLATPSGTKMPTCEAKKGWSAKGFCG